MLYEIAMIETPSIKQAEDGETEKLVFGPITVVAGNSQAAAVIAMTDPDNVTKLASVNKQRLEVIVRPFAA